MSETISVAEARRLALARAGLLRPELTGLPRKAAAAPRRACYDVIRRFGYLQLDTIAIAGARSHSLVLLSRLEALDPGLPETLLRPRAPLFEYWGHEASWIPMELYPAFEFRRQEFKRNDPWWGPVLRENRSLARKILKRARDEGPVRTADLEDKTERDDWGYTRSKRVLRSLWKAGELAVVRRREFQPEYDLSERVIPAKYRSRPLPEQEGMKALLLRALAGHGWAERRTLAATWRLKNRREQIETYLEELREDGCVVPCALSGRKGWVRPSDLASIASLKRARPNAARGTLLSPFDPVLWDRERVRLLFDFDQVLEIFKPQSQRVYGYYAMPVLAGDRLVARCDIKAETSARRLRVLAIHDETDERSPAVRNALERHAAALGLALDLG